MTPIRPLPLSAIVLTFNEEGNIRACLESLAGWVGQIVVVDSGSTDRTQAIAGEYTTQIAIHPYENYSQQRNWAQENSGLLYDWVLHIDADERVSQELRIAIEDFFDGGLHSRYNGAMFPRRALFMGRWIRHGGFYPVYHTRLFHRHRGRCEQRLYDQHFLVEAPVLQMDGDLIDIMTSDLDVWSQRHIRWAGFEAAEQMSELGSSAAQVVGRLSGNPIERRRWQRNAVYGQMPLFGRAFGYFCYRYFVRAGFLDGVEGLIFHVLQGFWYRFYVDVKIWEARNKISDGTKDALHRG